MTGRTSEQEERFLRLLNTIAAEDEAHAAGKVLREVFVDGHIELVDFDEEDLQPGGRRPLSFRRVRNPDGTWGLEPISDYRYGRRRLGYDR